jgi:hypothetical protein
MRLFETVLNEDIEWQEPDKSTFMSLKGLVNKHNGIYTSTKQQWYVQKHIIANQSKQDAAFIKSNWGVDLTNPENPTVRVSGLYRWAGYGSRSLIPFYYIFEMDNEGVVALWKIGAHGNLRQGAGPDPKKAKREWVRPEGVDTSHLTPPVADQKKEFLKSLGKASGQYIGTVGEKKHAFGLVTVKAIKQLDSYVVGYNIATERWFHVFEDENQNQIWYTGKNLGLRVGQQLKLTATIKKHLISKRTEHVTVVQRPQFEKELFINQEVTPSEEKV